MAPARDERFGPMTPEEYCALEAKSNVRHEYVYGYIYAFAGGT